MADKAILVIDLGTSKARASLIAANDGSVISNHAVGYELIRPELYMAELRAETV